MNRCDMLNLGEVQVTAGLTWQGAGNAPVCVPVKAVLIRTDDRNILLDTGCGDGSRNGSMPWWCGEEETLPAQLARFGLTCADIGTVVLSHTHADHAGGMTLFPQAELWVPAEDWQKSGLAAPGRLLHRVKLGEDCEIAPGVRILTLPGHTANLLGLLVQTAAGWLLFPSDAVYTPKNYGPPAVLSGSVCQEAQYLASIEKIRETARKYGAEVQFFHSPVEFRTIRK